MSDLFISVSLFSTSALKITRSISISRSPTGITCDTTTLLSGATSLKEVTASISVLTLSSVGFFPLDYLSRYV